MNPTRRLEIKITKMNRRRVSWILVIIGAVMSLVSISVMEEADFAVALQAQKANIPQHFSFTFLNLCFVAGIVSLVLGLLLGLKQFNRG